MEQSALRSDLLNSVSVFDGSLLDLDLCSHGLAAGLIVEVSFGSDLDPDLVGAFFQSLLHSDLTRGLGDSYTLIT